MASRKELKEQARAQREAVASQQAAADARRRRLTILGVIVAIAVVVVIVVVVAGGGGGGPSKGLKKGSQANATSRQVSSLLAGVPQKANRLGNPNAPVTMTYYGDLECPVCQAFTLQSLPQVISNLVRPGKLQIVYRSLQTATNDPNVFQTQQVAALAAGKQNLMWHYVELFYHEQGAEGTNYVDESYLTGLARQIPGLNVASWQSARKDPALAGEVRADATSASIIGADSTPTLVFKGPKGTRKVSAALTAGGVASAVKQVS